MKCSDTAFNGEPERAHLRVKYRPKVAVSTLINALKRVSARPLRQVRPDAQGRTGQLAIGEQRLDLCGGRPAPMRVRLFGARLAIQHRRAGFRRRLFCFGRRGFFVRGRIVRRHGGTRDPLLL